MMNVSSRYIGAKEHRLLRLNSAPLKEFGRELKEDYFAPSNTAAVDRVALAAAGALNIVLRGPDAVLKSLTMRSDEQLGEQPSGILAYTRDNTTNLLDGIVHLRPLKTLAELIAIPGNIAMDATNIIVGKTK